MESILELQNVDPYSTKTAMKNMKALSGCSIELLQYLSDQFINSKRRPHLKVLYQLMVFSTYVLVCGNRKLHNDLETAYNSSLRMSGCSYLSI